LDDGIPRELNFILSPSLCRSLDLQSTTFNSRNQKRFQDEMNRLKTRKRRKRRGERLALSIRVRVSQILLIAFLLTMNHLELSPKRQKTRKLGIGSCLFDESGLMAELGSRDSQGIHQVRP
jgi:hypothetical protein